MNCYGPTLKFVNFFLFHTVLGYIKSENLLTQINTLKEKYSKRESYISIRVGIVSIKSGELKKIITSILRIL